MIGTYTTLRNVQSGLIFLTHGQRLWMENMRVALLAHVISPPPRPPVLPVGTPQLLVRLQRLFFRVSQTSAMHIFFLVATFGSIAVMCMHYTGASEGYTRGLRDAEAFFLALFCCELMIKLVAQGPRMFLSVRFWLSDLLPIASSAASLHSNGSTLGSMMRLMRLTRSARFIHNNKGLVRLMHTIVLALPGVGNALLIIAMNLFIWACIGMNLFSGVRYGSMGFMGPFANFDTFPLALLTCFRCITGENFNGIMRELMAPPPYCALPEGGTPGTCIPIAYAATFFVGLYTISVYVLSQVLTAVIYEAYNFTLDDAVDRGGAFRLNTVAAEQFVRLWTTLDPEGSMQLDAGSIALILCDLNYPLGLKNDPRLAHLAQTPLLERALKDVREGAAKVAKKVSSEVRDGAAKVASKVAPNLLMGTSKRVPDSGAPAPAPAPAPAAPPLAVLSQTKRRAALRGRNRSLGDMWRVDNTEEARARRHAARSRIPLELQLLAKNVFERLGLVPTVRNKYSYFTVLHALIERASLGAPLVGAGAPLSALRATVVNRAKSDAPAGSPGDLFSLAMRRAIIKLQQRWRAVFAARRKAAAENNRELLS
jgi:hypothetical protein